VQTMHFVSNFLFNLIRSLISAPELHLLALKYANYTMQGGVIPGLRPLKCTKTVGGRTPLGSLQKSYHRDNWLVAAKRSGFRGGRVTEGGGGSRNSGVF